MLFHRKRSHLKTTFSQKTYRSCNKYRINTLGDTSQTSKFTSTNHKTEYLQSPSNKFKKCKLQYKNHSHIIQQHALNSTSPLKKNLFQSNHFQIQSKMSTQPHKSIKSYGISTYKGDKNINNPHLIGIHLGTFKNFMLIQSFEGSLAAKYIKDVYPIKLLELTANKSLTLQKAAKLALQLSQNQLVKKQMQMKNNSGAFLSSFIVEDNILTFSNIGASKILCQRNQGDIINFAENHTTENNNEIKRLKNNQIKIYQQKVITPFESEQKQCSSPLKIMPSGLSYTRILGRGFDYRKQKYYCDKQKGLISQPHIQSVDIKGIRWVGIFSQNVLKNCSQNWISEIIRKQISRKTTSYTQHHIALECSFKIINQVVKSKPDQAASAIIILFSTSSVSNQSTTTYKMKLFPTNNNPERGTSSKIKDRPVSLRYIGHRRSFLKKHESLNKQKHKNMI